MEVNMSEENNAIIVKFDKRKESIPTQDVFRSNLILFQNGIQNLEKGSKLLNKVLKPTPIEMLISLIALKLSEKMRLRRLLNLDLVATQKKFLNKSNETLSSLDKIIKLLDDRYSKSSEVSISATSQLEESLTKKEQLKEEENALNKELKKALSEYEENDIEIEKVAKSREIRELRKKQQDAILQQEKGKAQVKTLQSLSKTEGTHAEYSYNMLKKLLPIQELISVNKDILYTRIEMLNRMVAAGSILKPLGELSEELGNVSLQFAEANAMLNNAMEELTITY